MNCLKSKKILLGVSGGIAAYKSAELIRLLLKQGAEVRVVMTQSAQQFITSLTLQALSGNPVATSLWDEEAEAAMGHIELARWADLILIAPASANTIARLANGMADELLSTLCLATTAPIAIAPAMNQQMWLSTATQENMQVLRDREVRVLGPDEGEQACGEVGPGRMLEPEKLLQGINRQFENGHLLGQVVVITAGPTREYIDPVRYISNRSSGKMGYAVADAAIEAGAEVILISGPVALKAPEGAALIPVETAEEMADAVKSVIIDADIFISAAAVADYRIEDMADEKIKKHDANLTLNLSRTEDILAHVANYPDGPFTVGFAAETQELEVYAKAKLENKGLDMVAANLVGPKLAFDQDDNALNVYWPGGMAVLEKNTKQRIARQLIELIAEQYEESHRLKAAGSETRH